MRSGTQKHTLTPPCKHSQPLLLRKYNRMTTPTNSKKADYGPSPFRGRVELAVDSQSERRLRAHSLQAHT